MPAEADEPAAEPAGQRPVAAPNGAVAANGAAASSGTAGASSGTAGASSGTAGLNGAAGRPAGTSRRFPLITRDTARPEGGGRAASGGAPAPARQWPLLMVMAGVGVGLLVVALDAFRAGTVLVGLSLLSGALLRWALPEVGMLAVRSRFTDMLTYGVLGSAIVLLSLMVQPDPWLKIPFLQDVVHFTVR
ncbi:DUF3017 domain-containing protein [Streptomyces sp. ME19-01-6]|uniref:DUF3017 domain-containing protein n=1 Tax=Streptomyces sp. ME19-01-6 TaxID=3028686 RepID=UPI0029A97F82|nr:DUF3017 domain-containing protein [Streptomyces sp. ME19-01-6]MDX3227467.1 DUF3017 domain-containing protein [Streptomyces sp. ME19-01-6]